MPPPQPHTLPPTTTSTTTTISHPLITTTHAPPPPTHTHCYLPVLSGSHTMVCYLLLLPHPLQVLVLSCGRLIFFGPCSGLIPWLSDHLGYAYEPDKGGIAPDFVMDLVNIAFKKPKVGRMGLWLGFWGFGGFRRFRGS